MCIYLWELLQAIVAGYPLNRLLEQGISLDFMQCSFKKKNALISIVIQIIYILLAVLACKHQTLYHS